jgi:hypothetical protein
MTAADQAGRTPGDGQSGAARGFARAGFDLIGLSAGEDELAVIEAVDALYRPLMDALLRAELDGIEAEPGTDLSTAPRAVEQR